MKNNLYLDCVECGESSIHSTQFKKHLKGRHQLDVYQYGLKHNLKFVVSINNKKREVKNFTNKCKLCGSEFVLTVDKSHNVVIKKCKSAKQCNPAKDPNGRARQLFEGETLVEIDKEIHDNCINTRASLNNYIKKYGEKEGRKLHKKYTDTTKTDLAHFVNKYGQEEGEKRFEDFKNKSKQTKENFIKRHGEKEGNRKWEKFIKNKKQTSPRSLEYWLKKTNGNKDLAKKKLRTFQAVTLKTMIAKYGKDEGTRKWKQSSFYRGYYSTKEGFIEKYGEEDGLKKYQEKSKRISYSNSFEGLSASHGTAKALQIMNKRCFKDTGISKVATKAFQKIEKELKLNTSFFGDNEYFVSGKDGDVSFFYFLDFYNKDLNLAIEFYGDYWHFNPKKYKKDQVVRTKLVKDVWEKDRIRKERIQNKLQTNLYVIWEDDWRNFKNEIIADLKEVVNGRV